MSRELYPENPEETQVIVGLMNMGYISDTARNRTHNLFRPKCEPIPLGHSDGRGLDYIDIHIYLYNYNNMFSMYFRPRFLQQNLVQPNLHPFLEVQNSGFVL